MKISKILKLKTRNPKFLILTFLIVLLIIFTIDLVPNKLYFLKKQNQESLESLNMDTLVSSSSNSWTPNGTAICTEEEDQTDIQICSDGTGGAIITWQDYRNGLSNDIYAQRVNSTGIIQWQIDGRAISTANESQQKPQICSDGADGAIIAWEDYRSGSNYDIYAQRVNSTGTMYWPVDGVAITTANGSQQILQICSDGAGGAIIAWEDYRSGSNYDIYAQRVNSTGIIQWTPDDTVICSEIESQRKPQIYSDGAGGAIIVWEDYRSGSSYDIYAQKVNSDGIIQWTPNGTMICAANESQRKPQLCSDGAGGAFIAWEDHRTHLDVYAQRVDSAGTIQWPIDGIAISTAYECQQDVQICSDGAGGAILTWEDHREYAPGNLEFDIYAQRIGLTGNIKWTLDGKAICTETGVQELPQICSDGAGGAIITWMDRRSGGEALAGWHIYAQKITSNGKLIWSINGIDVCTVLTHRFPKICSDGAGGGIISWEDQRGETKDVYAQRVSGGEGGFIPFGNFFLLFFILSIFSLGILIKRRFFRNSKY